MALPAFKEATPPTVETPERQSGYPPPPHPRPGTWTVEEYFVLLEANETTLEYIDGTIYDMPGATDEHNQIIPNITIALGNQLRGSKCSLRSSTMQVRVDETKYVFPDLSVVCGKAQLDNDNLTLLNPIVVAEVISPSSVRYDRITKRAFYQAIPSVRTYLIVEQRRVHVELHTRLEDGWALQEYSDMDDKLVIESVNCELALAEVYAGVALPER